MTYLYTVHLLNLHGIKLLHSHIPLIIQPHKRKGGRGGGKSICSWRQTHNLISDKAGVCAALERLPHRGRGRNFEVNIYVLQTLPSAALSADQKPCRPRPAPAEEASSRAKWGGSTSPLRSAPRKAAPARCPPAPAGPVTGTALHRRQLLGPRRMRARPRWALSTPGLLTGPSRHSRPAAGRAAAPPWARTARPGRGHGFQLAAITPLRGRTWRQTDGAGEEGQAGNGTGRSAASPAPPPRKRPAPLRAPAHPEAHTSSDSRDGPSPPEELARWRTCVKWRDCRPGRASPLRGS